MPAPSRSLEQRRTALNRANDIRGRRAKFKRDLKAGRYSSVAVLAAEPPYWLATMKVFDVLIAMPRIGRVKANKLLTRARISPSKTLGGMTQRQRVDLANALPSSLPIGTPATR